MSAPEVVDDSAPVERYDENTEAGVNPNTSGENVSEDRVQGGQSQVLCLITDLTDPSYRLTAIRRP